MPVGSGKDSLVLVISSRRVFTFFVVGFLILGYSSGIASATRGHAASGSSTTVPTGSVTFGNIQFPNTLNPFLATSAVEAENQNVIMPMGLGPYYDPSGNAQPGMLAEVPTVDNGGIDADHTTYHFHLRSGLLWSDGTPITSQDVVFAWHVTANLQGCDDTTCGLITSMSVQSGTDFSWTLSKPRADAEVSAWPGLLPHTWADTASTRGLGTAADLLSCLNATPPAFVGCQAVGQRLEQPYFNYESSSYVTAGPYQVQTVTPQQSITYTPNPNYTNAAPGGSPKIAQLKFVRYYDTTAMIAAANSQEADVTEGYSLESLPKLEGQNFTTLSSTGVAPEMLVFNAYNAITDIAGANSTTVPGVSNPLVDTRVRQALALAYDRVGLLEAAHGISQSDAQRLVSYGVPLLRSQSSQPFYSDPAITGIWDPIAGAYVIPGSAVAIADAKTLMTHAGYPQGSTVPTVYLDIYGNPYRDAEASYLKAAWQAIGINTVFEYPGNMFDTYAQDGALARGHFEVALFGLLPGQPEPDMWDQFFLSTDCPQTADPNSRTAMNYSCIQDSTIDQALLQASSSLDRATQHSAYNSFSEEVAKQAFWAVVGPVVPPIWTTDGKVDGVQLNPYASDASWNLFDLTWNVFDWTSAATPKTLTVSLNASGTYGSAHDLTAIPASSPSITYSPAGEVSNVTGTLSCSTSAGTTSPVAGSPYPVSSCSGLSDPGFTVVYDYAHSGYSVTPASLLVTAQNKTVAHGHQLPTLTWSATFVHGDSAASLTKQPVCTTTAKLDTSKNVVSPAGHYSITCSGAQAANYTITYHAGVLTVTLEATHLSYTGPTTLHVNKTGHVSALLKSDRGKLVSGRKVTFILGTGRTAVSCTGVTNAKGAATCSVKPPSGSTKRNLTMAFAGDKPGATYFFASTHSTKTLQVKA
jgi:ABC-type transport system substrate-binding protein